MSSCFCSPAALIFLGHRGRNGCKLADWQKPTQYHRCLAETAPSLQLAFLCTVTRSLHKAWDESERLPAHTSRFGMREETCSIYAHPRDAVGLARTTCRCLRDCVHNVFSCSCSRETGYLKSLMFVQIVCTPFLLPVGLSSEVERKHKEALRSCLHVFQPALVAQMTIKARQGMSCINHLQRNTMAWAVAGSEGSLSVSQSAAAQLMLYKPYQAGRVRIFSFGPRESFSGCWETIAWPQSAKVDGPMLGSFRRCTSNWLHRMPFWSS